MGEKVEIFHLDTPKGVISKVRLPNGEFEMELKWNEGFGKEMSQKFNNVQQYVDSEVLRKCQPYVPFDTGILDQSGIMNTRIGSGQVIYRTPYARRWYYINAKFQGAPQRGKQWFERMKNDGGKEAILREAKKIVGA